MKIVYLLFVSGLFISCGGGGSDSASSDTGLNGRYVGTLRGASCVSGQMREIDLVHDVDVSAPESESPVTVVDSEGNLYNGNFVTFVRPEGNLYGFNVRRDADSRTDLPLSFTYNFSGLPSGQADVTGFSSEGLTGGCDEFSGSLERMSGD